MRVWTRPGAGTGEATSRARAKGTPGAGVGEKAVAALPVKCRNLRAWALWEALQSFSCAAHANVWRIVQPLAKHWIGKLVTSWSAKFCKSMGSEKISWARGAAIVSVFKQRAQMFCRARWVEGCGFVEVA